MKSVTTELNTSKIEIIRAAPAELSSVKTLLEASRLPTEGVDESIDDFFVARHGDEVIGAIGMERHGDFALLRSAAVSKEWQGRGVGRELVERLLEEAEAGGVEAVYLLTTTAENYFPAFGFQRVERESVPADLMASPEFQGACPSSAAVMRREGRKATSRL